MCFGGRSKIIEIRLKKLIIIKVKEKVNYINKIRIQIFTSNNKFMSHVSSGLKLINIK